MDNTIGEQLFDAETDTPGVAPSAPNGGTREETRVSAAPADLVGLADRTPDPAQVDAGLHGLLDGLPVELGEHVVAGQRSRPDGPELAFHQLAEMTLSHRASLTPGVGGGPPLPTAARSTARR